MTIHTSPRKFTPQTILDRAAVYGLVIQIDGDRLIVDIPYDLEPATKNKALEVIETYKEVIIDYLSQQDEAYRREIDEYVLHNPALCSVCLDLGGDVPALSKDHRGIMYCMEHHLIRKHIERVDGVRIFVGYSDLEYKKFIQQEVQAGL